MHAAFLRQHPVCCACGQRGRVVPAVVADHVTPLKDGGARFDTGNLQALCISCHNLETERETAGRR
ncbi:HNH endonuclease [Polaromonas eurypsychrophila]